MNTEKIGAFIKEQRKNKNLTQKELAEILSCTDKAVSRWETGRGVPEISFLIPLSDALGISVNELLLGEKIEKEKIEEKTEQLIIETITETHKKTGGLKNMIYALLIIIEVKFVQLCKQLYSIYSTDFGISISCNDIQLLKHLLPI